ncbi:cytochrome P450 [Protomyces lactucae-debilis]|uniref:Cytochrome P450 n=1 Tax=Protomyces lactucae-debilis TaxID=2754530 RepID=A0A1Y2FAC8_PROLT|nr:cytochrome P450 [Protomyces lactucae-debilis]ORY80872.1 cytochrome P450 [Protomyces lactucae-debilis]
MVAPTQKKKAKTNGAVRKPIPGAHISDVLMGRFSVSIDNPLITTSNLRKLYGELYMVKIVGLQKTFAASQRMANAVLSRPDCVKATHEFLQVLRDGQPQSGLFTAYNDEEDWGIAHRVLMPVFGPMAVRGMWDPMVEIAAVMVSRFNAHQNEIIDLPDQLTRLTLDTIALCSFDYRFNSFFKEDMHPFIGDMLTFLKLSAERSLLPLTAKFKVAKNWQRLAAAERMQQFGLRLLNERRASGERYDDLASRMLDVADPETGKKLSDDSIVAQLVTFLVAGHETTSGLLSFCLYYMMKNPETMRKAQAEVDALGHITLDSLAKMPYIDACLKEALRMQPTAPMIGVCCKEDVELPEGYMLPAGDTMMIDLHGVHNDPAVYDNPSEFRPERMLNGGFEALPPNSWKPFGHGMRACIGRAFALQEAMLAVATIVQNFDLELADPNYKFRVKFTLTIKPDELKVKLKRRQAGPPIMPLCVGQEAPKRRETAKANGGPTTGAKPMLVLFGSNSGACEALSKDVAASAANWGYSAQRDTLDSCRELPTDRPVLILTPSYEGKPADNARQFAAYLESGPDLKGVKYAIFGAGHSDWAQTYQKIPRTFDEQMSNGGAESLIPRAEGNVAGDFVGDFDSWKADLAEELSDGDVTASESADSKRFMYEPISSKTANSIVGAGLGLGKVISNVELVKASELGPSKRHITLELPDQQEYNVGDYLNILPINPDASVLRVLKHFGMDESSKVKVDVGEGATSKVLAVRAYDILQTSVELATPVSKRMLSRLEESCEDKQDKAFIKSLSGDAYQSKVINKRMSAIDLLEHCKSCQVSFDDYIKSLQSMHQRQYSISSSPIPEPRHATLTIDVLSGSALSGTGNFLGITSNFLSTLKAGDEISCSVRSSSNFSLPERVETPIVLFAAGTGIAPFRGFLQERTLQVLAGRKVGKTILFYGCRTEEDFLHKEELQGFAKESGGVIDVRHCYSRKPTETGGCKYVQDLLLKQRSEVLSLFKQGARLYTCGSASKLAHSLKKAFGQIVDEAKEGEEREAAQELVDAMGTNRYAVDIFG